MRGAGLCCPRGEDLVDHTKVLGVLGIIARVGLLLVSLGHVTCVEDQLLVGDVPVHLGLVGVGVGGFRDRHGVLWVGED